MFSTGAVTARERRKSKRRLWTTSGEENVEQEKGTGHLANVITMLTVTKTVVATWRTWDPWGAASAKP